MEDKDLTPEEKLIWEAWIEFAEKGFDSASLNQIIKRAGISKGSFYHHFSSKEDLFAKVINRAAEEKLAFINKWAENNHPGVSLGFFDRLYFHMVGGVEFARQRPELMAFILNVLKNPEMQNRTSALVPAYYDRAFDAALVEAQQKGELRNNIDPEFARRMLKYTLLGFSQLILDSSEEHPDQVQLKQQIDCYIEFLRKGLGASMGEETMDRS